MYRSLKQHIKLPIINIVAVLFGSSIIQFTPLRSNISHCHFYKSTIDYKCTKSTSTWECISIHIKQAIINVCMFSLMQNQLSKHLHCRLGKLKPMVFAHVVINFKDMLIFLQIHYNHGCLSCVIKLVHSKCNSTVQCVIRRAIVSTNN